MSSNHQTAEEMKTALGIETPAEEPAEPAPPVEEPPPDPPAEPPAEPAQPAAAKPAEKTKKNPQERIDKVVYEREEAKREAARERAARESSERKIEELRAEWRREFESLKQERTKPQEQAKPSDPNADPEPDYTNTDAYPDGQFDRKYLKDQARWEARQEFKEQQRVATERYQAEQRERQQYERQRAEQERITGFAQKIEGVLRDQPELRARIEGVAMSRPMWDAVVESEQPHQLLAYMADHPEEAEQITQLPPLHAFRRMSRLDFELEKAAAITGSAPAKPKTSAYPPVSPVSGSHSAPSSGAPDPATCTQEEFDAYWNAQEKARQKAGRR